MELKDLLDNPDYVNANTATRKAIFEKYSKGNADYVKANDDTRRAIHERFGLGGVAVTEPLPEKITDFSGRDFGNMLKQSFSEANAQIAKTGRTPVVGPAVLGAVGETIKGVGAIGELATDRAQGITKVGQAITEGAKEANMPAATVGQVGSYIAPYKLAQKGIQATAGAVPYLRGAVNPATTLGSTGELVGAGALVGGLTTPGSYDERMNEAQLQALMGGGTNLALRGAMAVPGAVRQIRTGATEGLNPTYRPGPNTAFAEVGENFYPNKAVGPFMKMSPEQQVQALPALEASQQPSSGLFSGFLNKAAQRLAPEGPKGGTLVPLEGKGLQAFTEQTTRDFFNKPSINNLGGFTGNVGGAIIGGLTGGPVGAAAGLFAPQYIRALEILAQRRLQNVAGLKPGFAEQLGAAQQTAGKIGLQNAVAQTPPRLGYTPQQGGGGTGGNPTMYVGPTGEATTNLSGTQVIMNPGTFGQTPAAQAAMATTQRVAGTTTRAPRAQTQPRTEWTLPDAATHYNAAAESSSNFGDTFNKAVAERTKDLLKDARQRGQKLTPEMADALAYDQIKEWRSKNVPAFMEKKSDVGPTTTTNEAPKPIKQGFEKVGSTDPAIDYDRNLWLGLQAKVQRGEALKSYEQTQANSLTKKYGPDPFGSGDLQGKKLFNTEAVGENKVTPAVETPKVETPTTKNITAEQQAKRDNFVNVSVKERVKQMEQQRADNKEMFADEAERMREMAADQKMRKGPPKSFTRSGIPSSQMPNPKDVFTERKAVADMVNQVSIGNVTSKNKNIVVRRSGYDAMADDIGITLDWTTAPKAGKTIAETRKVMDKWMMDTINKEIPELGLYKRQESLIQQGKRLTKEMDAERAKMTPEQLAAEKAAAESPEFRKRMDTLAKLTRKDTPTPKSTTPKTEAPKTETPKQEPVVEPSEAERTANTNKILEMIRSRQKNKPSGTMEMKTGGKEFASKADFEEQQLIDRLSGKITTGSYTDNGMRYEITEINYGNTPKDFLKRLNKPLTQVRVFSEKTNKQVSGPAREVPEKPLRQRIEEQRKRK